MRLSSRARACDPASGLLAAWCIFSSGSRGSSFLSSHFSSPAIKLLRAFSGNADTSRLGFSTGFMLPSRRSSSARTSPFHRMAPRASSTPSMSAATSWSAFVPSSLGSAFSAAARSMRRSSWRAEESTLNRNPSTWPSTSPSTLTSPLSFNSIGSMPASCPSDFINIAVLRFTNLSVSRAWSASDNLASTARARDAISSRASTQSGRWQI